MQGGDMPKKSPPKAKPPAVKLYKAPPKDMEAGAMEKPRDRKDIGKFVTSLFEKHNFSAVEELVKLAIDPPEDMKTSERIAVLKHLSEYEAPKAKSESLVAGQAQSTGIHISVVQFGSQDAVREKLPPSAYAQFAPKASDATDVEEGQ